MRNRVNQVLLERDANVMAVLARWWRLCGREVFTEADLRERMELLNLGSNATSSLAVLASAGYISVPSPETITLTDAGQTLALQMDIGKVALAA